MESLPLLKICLHYDNMPVPHKAHETDTGIDLTVMSIDKKTPNIFLFDTGISIEFSKGFYAEIVPRSSIINTDFFLANSIGIIDSDYRGRIFMPFRYIGDSNAEEEAQKLLHKRIGQLIIRKLEQCRIKIVKSLDKTDRGEDGFGSTGI